MDNQETLATLDTQDTGRKQTQQKHNTEKTMCNTDPPKWPEVNPGVHKMLTVIASYKTPAMLLI
jgi:hypothetical protein